MRKAIFTEICRGILLSVAEISRPVFRCLVAVDSGRTKLEQKIIPIGAPDAFAVRVEEEAKAALQQCFAQHFCCSPEREQSWLC